MSNVKDCFVLGFETFHYKFYYSICNEAFIRRLTTTLRVEDGTFKDDLELIGFISRRNILNFRGGQTLKELKDVVKILYRSLHNTL